MKKYCYICVAAFLQWVLVACTDLQETINNDNPVAAVVHADIASDSYTRTTVDDTGWQVGDAIGVFVTSAGNTTGENVKYVAAIPRGISRPDSPSISWTGMRPFSQRIILI